MNRRHLAALATGLAVAAAGCAGPAPSDPPVPTPAPGTGLPARPAILSFAGVDPCTLLSPAQQAGLGVGLGHRNDPGTGMPLEGTACDWTTNRSRQQVAHSAVLATNRGAEAALGQEPPRTVAGYAATTTSSAYADPRWQCYVVVDTGPGQSLVSDYTVETRDIPAMTHEKACDIAQTAAEMMLANLRAGQPPKDR